MNSKIIAAGVVVALCAVALIGVGYAYTAMVTDTNQFDSEYVILTIGDGGETSYATPIFTGTMKFDTQTTINGTQWRVSEQTIGNNGSALRIALNNVPDAPDSIKLSLTTVESGSNSISNILEGAEITFSYNDSVTTDDVVYVNSGGNWSLKSGSVQVFDVDESYKASLKTVTGDWNTLNQPPSSSVSFTMTLTYNSTIA